MTAAGPVDVRGERVAQPLAWLLSVRAPKIRLIHGRGAA
jgi:hypothetical protein